MNQVRSQGETIIEEKNVGNFLRSLPPKFDQVVIAIVESKNIPTLNVVVLISSLQSCEEHMQYCTKKLV